MTSQIALLKGKLSSPNIIQATEGLIEALALLPTGTHARVFRSISVGHQEFWMQFECSIPGSLDLFCKLCRESGIAMVEMVAKNVHPPSSEELLGNICGVATPVVALTVSETCDVTMPGSMRELASSLCKRSLHGFCVLDFQIAAQTGLAWFGVTVILSLKQQQDTNLAACEATELVGVSLNVIPRLHVGSTARRIMARIESGSRDWRRPRLSASLGNIADLFPL